MPLCFALLAVLAFHHYDTVYRLRHQRLAPPAWLRAAGGGWEGRVLVACVLALAGVLGPGLLVAAVGARRALPHRDRGELGPLRPRRAPRRARRRGRGGAGRVKGLVLAAGQAQRLRPLTADLPKTLLPVDGDTTILDLTLANLRAVGIEDVAIVTGFAAERLEERARRAGAPPRRAARADPQRPAGVEQRLLAVDGARRAARRRAARQRRHGAPRGGRGAAARGARPRAPARRGRREGARRGGDEGAALAARAGCSASTRGSIPAAAQGEYIGLALIEPDAAERAGRGARGHLAARHDALLRGRLPGLRRRRRRGARGADRHRGLGRGRRPRRPRPGAGDRAAASPEPADRVPLLARMVAFPLTVDVRSGAVRGIDALLADSPPLPARPRGRRRRARARGSRSWRRPARRCATRTCRWWRAARSRPPRRSRPTCARGSYDAVVGIGGGRTLDVAKYAATLTGLPMVAVATSLAHDGLASPVASLEHEGGKSSYGVAIPLAVVVDLDYVRRCPRRAAALRHRRRPEQPQRAGRLGAGRPGAGRADGRRGRRARAHGRRVAAAPHGRHRVRGLPHHARPGAHPRRPGHGHRGQQPPVQRRLPRDRPRDRGAASRHEHARRPGGGRRAVRLLAARRRRSSTRSTRACAATTCRACPPTSGSPRRSSPTPSPARPRRGPERYTILEHLELGEAEIAARVAAFVEDVRVTPRRPAGGRGASYPRWRCPDARGAA